MIIGRTCPDLATQFCDWKPTFLEHVLAETVLLCLGAFLDGRPTKSVGQPVGRVDRLLACHLGRVVRGIWVTAASGTTYFIYDVILALRYLCYK